MLLIMPHFGKHSACARGHEASTRTLRAGAAPGRAGARGRAQAASLQASDPRHWRAAAGVRDALGPLVPRQPQSPLFFQ